MQLDDNPAVAGGWFWPRRPGAWFIAILLWLLAWGPCPTLPQTMAGAVGVDKVEIPGGSLEAHEKAGGHMLARHVGKTAAELRKRLETDTRISAASSFLDRRSADEAVSATLKFNQRKIEAWLKRDEDRLVITHRGGGPIGISVTRTGTAPRNVTGTRLVLVRDSKFPGGWRILTGYPEL